MAAIYGERAQKVDEINEHCRACMLHNRNMTGREECSRPDGCGKEAELAKLPPTPQLEGHNRFILEFFASTAPSLWSSGFGVAHVPRNELAAEAEARGFELTEFDLEKYRICEREFRAAIKRQSP